LQERHSSSLCRLCTYRKGSRGRPALPRGRRACFQFVSVAGRRVKWPQPGLGTSARAFLERHARTFCRPATRTPARSPRPFHTACRSIGELCARCGRVHVAFAGGRCHSARFTMWQLKQPVLSFPCIRTRFGIAAELHCSPRIRCASAGFI
jgi:hypothetical protein